MRFLRSSRLCHVGQSRTGLMWPKTVHLHAVLHSKREHIRHRSQTVFGSILGPLDLLLTPFKPKVAKTGCRRPQFGSDMVQLFWFLLGCLLSLLHLLCLPAVLCGCERANPLLPPLPLPLLVPLPPQQGTCRARIKRTMTTSVVLVPPSAP